MLTMASIYEIYSRTNALTPSQADDCDYNDYSVGLPISH